MAKEPVRYFSLDYYFPRGLSVFLKLRTRPWCADSVVAEAGQLLNTAQD